MTHAESAPVANLDRAPIMVNDREQLIYLLTEAAEIEHGLMCCYLFAAWSLKQDVDEGITPEQLEMTGRWQKQIHSVAMEEMLHLALVSNLLISIGASPHFARPNFPVLPGYFASSVVMRLAPFDRDTAVHFVFLERPEGVELARAKGFEAPDAYQRHEYKERLTASAEDYGTVSHLYRGIAQGLSSLAGRLGEDVLFCGHPDAQVGHDLVSLPGLDTVGSLQQALAAIEIIVEQGEGAPGERDNSHYRRFKAIRDEYEDTLRQDPAFVPHRPVVTDPIMFRAIEPVGGNQVTAPVAARVLDLANACYHLMLRLLASGFGGGESASATRRICIEGAIGVMGVVKALGTILTRIPATVAGGTYTAGMNFHLPRVGLASSAMMLAERAEELAAAIDRLGRDLDGVDAALADRLSSLAGRLREHKGITA